jgi:hypothetical protein
LARKNTGELRLSSTGGTRLGGVDDVIGRAIFRGWDLTRSSEMRVAVQALLALALAGFAGGTVAARACDAAVHYSYNEPVEIEGVIKSGTGHHEAQGDFFYTYLELDQPVCVDTPKEGGDSDFGTTGTETPIGRIQVGGEASQSDLPADGTRVLVKGALFGAHTMWHVEPVLIDAASLAPKPK